MFPFGHNPYAPSFQTYDPYEELLLQQELQRRRQAEEYHRRRQLEELNRRRTEQLEYARRQAELQRRREAEARRRHQQELEARRRKLSEPAHARPSHLKNQEPLERDGGRRQSMFEGGVQDLFDMLYGGQDRPSTPTVHGKRSKSSDPRGGQQRVNPIWSQIEGDQQPVAENSAVSDTEEPDGPATPSQSAGTQSDSLGAESARSHSAISDVLKSFSDLKSAFAFPSKLDFLTSPGDTTVPAPKLAYTPNNAPLHQYEHLLTSLLTKLDAIESHGQESIRKARKDAVKQIEQELEGLDVKKMQEWRRQSEEVVPANVPMEVDSERLAKPSEQPTEPPEPPAESFELPMESKLISTDQADVDPASVPLPHDSEEDPKMHSEPDSPSSVATSAPVATPPAHPSNLPLSSDNAVTSDPSFAPIVEKSVPDASTESVRGATGGYGGVESTGLDKNVEPVDSQVDLDDAWEVEF